MNNAFINNRFMRLEEATLQVGDLSMQRGYGIFDYLRAVNGTPLFLQDHLDRFFASAAAMHLPLQQSRACIEQVIKTLAAGSSIAEAGIRIMLTGGYATDGYSIAQPNLVITCKHAAVATPQEFEKGLSVITYQHQRELPAVKSINYLMAVWLQPLRQQQQADDVLYFNNESITEFPRCNVFVVKNNKLVTPANNMLAGITRKQLLQIAPGVIEVEVRDIPVNELADADEMFLTATTRRLLPVLRINGNSVGNGSAGPVTRKLYNMFLQHEAVNS